MHFQLLDEYEIQYPFCFYLIHTIYFASEHNLQAGKWKCKQDGHDLFIVKMIIDLQVKNWHFGPENVGSHSQAGSLRQLTMHLPPLRHKLWSQVSISMNMN